MTRQAKALHVLRIAMKVCTNGFHDRTRAERYPLAHLGHSKGMGGTGKYLRILSCFLGIHIWVVCPHLIFVAIDAHFAVAHDERVDPSDVAHWPWSQNSVQSSSEGMCVLFKDL